ncbi:MAG: metallophosphoesterase [Clostridiales bacterium]|nr:metallophosphoesterase [Clostridiales bacterium]
MLYVIADTHLSGSVAKPMDVFRGWEDYTDRLKNNWNRVVGEDDTVVLPGDISWAMSLEESAADLAFLDGLNGRKIIGKGNHDYWWNTLTKMQRFINERGFTTLSVLYNNAYSVDGVCVCGTRGWQADDDTQQGLQIKQREAGRLRLSLEAGLKAGGELTAFIHYPPVWMDCVCPEMVAVLKEYGVRRCYFGHIHSLRPGAPGDFEYEGIRFTLISADYLGFCPKQVLIF